MGKCSGRACGRDPNAEFAWVFDSCHITSRYATTFAVNASCSPSTVCLTAGRFVHHVSSFFVT